MSGSKSRGHLFYLSSGNIYVLRVFMKKFPLEFEKRIHTILPDSEWESFFSLATEPLPKVVRIRDTDLIKKDDWQLGRTLIPEGYFIDRNDQSERPLGKTLAHFTGQIYSQSLSSMLPVHVLDPQPGEIILDMCAAPGSKTTFLSDRMAGQGLIVANEPSGTRSKKLVANLNRLGITNTVLLQSDGTILDRFLSPIFDRILLDAPCSSEGFGRRDARFFQSMWSLQSVQEMARLQRRLIVSAFNLLKVDGVMTYSTCTSAPEENEAVVQHLLDTFPGAVELLPMKIDNLPSAGGIDSWEGQSFDPVVSQNTLRLYPHQRTNAWNSESFFVCKLRKVSLTPLLEKKPITQTTNHSFLKKNTQAEIVTRLRKVFGLPKDWLGKNTLMEKSGEIYVCGPKMKSFCNTYLWRRAGLKILDKDQNITHEFVLKYGPLSTQNIYQLNDETLPRWLAGYDLLVSSQPTTAGKQITDNSNKAFIVKYENDSLGWGKVVNGKLKNKLPRDQVFDY